MIAKNANDPLMAFALHAAIRNIEERKSQSVWAVTGPGILRSAYVAEQSTHLFSGFEIVKMHSPAVRNVVQFRHGSHKSGPRDWRRMQEARESIFQVPDHLGTSDMDLREEQITASTSARQDEQSRSGDGLAHTTIEDWRSI
jgi:hypothetical protein